MIETLLALSLNLNLVNEESYKGLRLDREKTELVCADVYDCFALYWIY
jgi:hypothetical protein